MSNPHNAADLPLRFERRGHVALITLNRPHRHNAMSPEVVCRLDEAFACIRADPALRIAVITGAGDASFCSGGDLATTLPLLSGARAPEDEWDRRLLADPDMLWRTTLKTGDMDKPVIAAVNGICLAGGMELMLGTDIRVAASHAVFGLPEAKRGLIPFSGTLVRLPRQIPHALAMELLMLGDSIDADTALRCGLVNRVVAQEDVLPVALELAERIAANGPLAVREIKKTVTATSGLPLRQAYEIENASMDVVMRSADAREGPAAFVEKRKPVFQGV